MFRNKINERTKALIYSVFVMSLVTVSLLWIANNNKTVAQTETSAAPSALFSYTGPAVPIPDSVPAGVNIILPVAGVGTVGDLNFKFDVGAGTCNATVGNVEAAVDHTFVGDLTFKLTSPSGISTTFMARRGGTTENICSTTLDDEGGFPNISTLVAATGTFVSGNFSPELAGPFSVFDGVNANGNWTLNVSDNAGIDTGSLRRFSLDITAGGPSFTINDVAVPEGNAGTSNATFTVTLNPAAAVTTSVAFATANQTATQPSDYTSTAGTLTFLAGETTKQINVPVVGDTTFEPNETFAVNLTAPTGGALIGDAQGIGTITNDDVSLLPACNFSNGGLNPLATAENGTAAPAGKFWSEVQHNVGNTTEANTVGGFGVQSGLFRLADNFTVPAGGCQLNTVTFFAYQTNAPGPATPFSASTLRIWNGRPGDMGAAIVFGDTTTNRLASSVNSDLFRIFNTVVPTPTATGTTRIIWRNTLNVGASLTPGIYWLDWDLTATNAAAMFAPGKTIQGSRGAVGDNARQQTVAGGAWADVIDLGNPATAPDVPQDLPFFLNTLVTSDAPVDFNGDGKTDFAVTRNIGVGGSGATNQRRWFYNLNGTGGTVAQDWGVQTDIVIPEDFDGDGKDDLAVWRPGAATVAAFFILQSATNTVRIERFGQTGDDATIAADYDGDNKSDVAVYRSGAAAGQQSTWFYRGSFNNPSGNVTFVPWGTNGDFVAPGDYNGDGKNDFVVQRNNGGGQARFWTLLSTGAASSTVFGTPTDVIVPGDYDGDGKTDIATARIAAGAIQWQWLPSSGGAIQFRTFGASATDFPVQGDYDGDGRTDIAVWRAGVFFINATSTGATSFFSLGSAGDQSVARYNTH